MSENLHSLGRELLGGAQRYSGGSGKKHNIRGGPVRGKGVRGGKIVGRDSGNGDTDWGTNVVW